MANKTILQLAAATIIREQKLTAEKVHAMTNLGGLNAAITKHVKMRSPLSLTKMVISARHPVDVNGIELSNGRALLRAAAASVLMKEIQSQLLTKDRPIPRMAVARAS